MCEIIMFATFWPPNFLLYRNVERCLYQLAYVNYNLSDYINRKQHIQQLNKTGDWWKWKLLAISPSINLSQRAGCGRDFPLEIKSAVGKLTQRETVWNQAKQWTPILWFFMDSISPLHALDYSWVEEIMNSSDYSDGILHHYYRHYQR